MDTTTAAQQAGVTRATIRTWARMGAVKATKASGRWDIDPTSLTRRIALGNRKKENAVPTHSCGHPTRTARATPTLPCPSCRKAAWAKAHEEALAALLDGVTLPPLTGSPKQVEWANQLRTRALEGEDHGGGRRRLGANLYIEAKADGTWVLATGDMDPDEPGLTVKQARAVGLAEELSRSSARWWIDTYGR